MVNHPKPDDKINLLGTSRLQPLRLEMDNDVIFCNYSSHNHNSYPINRVFIWRKIDMGIMRMNMDTNKPSSVTTMLCSIKNLKKRFKTNSKKKKCIFIYSRDVIHGPLLSFLNLWHEKVSLYLSNTSAFFYLFSLLFGENMPHLLIQ